MAWWFVMVSSSKRALRVRRRRNEFWVILERQADASLDALSNQSKARRWCSWTRMRRAKDGAQAFSHQILDFAPPHRGGSFYLPV
jgi:hypothetical protein